jgi:hypothetical protein
MSSPRRKINSQQNVRNAKKRQLEQDVQKTTGQQHVRNVKKRRLAQDVQKITGQQNLRNAKKRRQKQQVPIQRITTVEQLLELDNPFQTIGKDPICTVLAHYFHSGAYRFHALRNLDHSNRSNNHKSRIKILRKELLSELLPSVTLQNKQKCFIQKNGLADNNKNEYGRICACACCGIKDTTTFSTVPITDIEELLSVPNEDPFINMLDHTTKVPVDRHGEQLGTISIKDVLHWHYSCQLHKWLYLHRNFVECDKNGVESCMLCPTCFKKLCQDNKVPELALANVNFGNFYIV